MRGNTFVKEAFALEGIFDYSALVRCLENPDAINALKNRNPDDPDRDLEISVQNSERLRYCLSLVNDLQLQFGPILEDDLVDISVTSRDEFDQYCVGRPTFAVYSEALAREAKHDRIIKQAQVDTARINAAIAQAQLDRLYERPLEDNTTEVTTTKLIDEVAPATVTTNVNNTSLREVELAVEEYLFNERNSPSESTHNNNSATNKLDPPLPSSHHRTLVQIAIEPM